MMEKRLIELETKLAYQEDLIQELNKTIFEQQKRLDQLDNGYRHLLEQARALADAGSDGKVVDEKPPHY